MGILARHLRSMTVLIVLDDVDDVDQIHALLPPKHNLGQGSFIIVTTREVDVLTSWGISSIYPMKLLDPLNAKQLFCRHAFLHPYSQLNVIENYHKDLIERFVEACNGLPLSLKVLGAMVNGKSNACWESQLRKISTILPNKIVECLKLSYDSLDQEEREMFLDAACFFIGEEKSMVVAIWDGSGWSGELGLETLVNKCLVGFDWYGRIQMHDHLRDLGREIGRDVSPSRIWREEQINIQGGRTLIRGMVLGLSWQNFWFTPAPLEHCLEKIIKRPSLPALKLLAVRGNYFREEFAALSRDLVWLRWCDFNGSNIPLWLSLSNLRVLELYNAENLQELWKDNVQPPLQLRELIVNLPEYLEEWWEHNPCPLQLSEWSIDLSWRTCFKGLPRSIGHLKHLRKIVLKGNASGFWMSRLPEEFCHLRSLEFLELSDFPELSSLPDNFGKLINLRSLNLSRLQLTALPYSLKQLRLLQFLVITNCRSLMFTSEMLGVLEFMTDLQVLRFSYCPKLEVLPHLTTQVSLRELDLRYTLLRKLPDSILHLTKLETLVIGSPNLTSLPGSLEKLSRLTYLETDECNRLEALPEGFRRLSNLRSLVIDTTPVLELGLGMGSSLECNLKNLKYISLLRTQIRRISISDDCCPSLETLMLMDSYELTDIETLPGNVRKIIVDRCEKLKNMMGIAGLVNLERLEVYDCVNLEVLPCPTYIHSLGRKITITGCPNVERQFQDLGIDHR